MKKLHLLSICFLLLASTVQAQSSKAKQKAAPAKKTTVAKQMSSSAKKAGWSAAEKEVFFDACLKELTWSKDSSTRYCNCMLEKIEKIYPSATDAVKLTQDKAVELATDCFATEIKQTTWSESQRTEFVKQCEASAAKNVGAEKAKAYCDCMQPKIEKEFPNPADLTKLTNEIVTRLAADCSKQ